MYPARVLYAAAFYVLSMALILVARPRALFDEHGRPRAFGTGAGATMFPLGVVTVAVAVLSLFAFALVDLVTADMA